MPSASSSRAGPTAAAAALVALSGAVLLPRALAPPPGDDPVRSVPAADTEHRARLNRYTRQTAHKRRLVDDLVAGRRTFREVAEGFRRCYEATGTLDRLRLLYPGAREVECDGRYVIDYLRNHDQGDPGRYAAVIARLESDYRPPPDGSCP